MLVYPQLETGALAQFPVHKARRPRTVINRAPDGSTIRIPDPAAETTEWLLTYKDLSDEEATALRSFFDAAEGTLQGFTFLDPTGNLLAFSEQLDDDVWQRDPLLTINAGIADPRATLLRGNSAIKVQATSGQVRRLRRPGNTSIALARMYGPRRRRTSCCRSLDARSRSQSPPNGRGCRRPERETPRRVPFTSPSRFRPIRRSRCSDCKPKRNAPHRATWRARAEVSTRTPIWGRTC